MIDIDAIKVVIQSVNVSLGCSQSLIDEAKVQLRLIEKKFKSYNFPISKCCKSDTVPVVSYYKCLKCDCIVEPERD